MYEIYERKCLVKNPLSWIAALLETASIIFKDENRTGKRFPVSVRRLDAGGETIDRCDPRDISELVSLDPKKGEKIFICTTDLDLKDSVDELIDHLEAY